MSDGRRASKEQYAFCLSPTFKVPCMRPLCRGFFFFFFIGLHISVDSCSYHKVMCADDSVAFTIVKDQAYALQMEIYEGSKRSRDEPAGSIAKLYTTCPPHSYRAACS